MLKQLSTRFLFPVNLQETKVEEKLKIITQTINIYLDPALICCDYYDLVLLDLTNKTSEIVRIAGSIDFVKLSFFS